MVVSPFLIRHANWLSSMVFSATSSQAKSMPVQLHLDDHVIIGGFGRLGSTVAGFLENNNIAYIAIETDIDLVEKHRKQGKNIVYGDSNSIEILNRCHLATARLMVLTFKSLEEGKAAIAKIRQHNSEIPIIVRCQEHHGFDELVSLGATHVFPELLESSIQVSRHVLEILSINEQEIENQIDEYRSVPHKLSDED
jgi:CPA2 family monovalent cation:H+ antiporter-2